MSVRPSALALTPLLLFLALFFGAGLYYTAQGEAMGFYQLRAPVAILPALALGVWLARRRGVPAQQTLLQGMGDSNVMLMCLIFLLAGAFATVSKAIGAVDAVVALGLGALPPSLILPGLFLVAAFVSLSIGTSMGTVAAVVPIALGVADAAGLDRVLVVGAVLGGAMFGDNLSIISDTTIAATRSQGAEMRDKFRENFKIALPAALLTIVLLATLGDAAPVQAPEAASAWLVLPYVLVLALALAGLDVVLVLGVGLVISGVFGFALAQDYDIVSFAGDIYLGFESMVEITLLSILIGGLAALIKATGGLDWLAQVIARFARGHKGRRSGEISIAALAAGSDALTANNTVAILVTGSLAKDIAERHGISPRRAASVLDIFACVVQGVLPYGAQILLAASLAAVSPLALAGSVHYCWLLALSALLFMLWPARRGASPPPASS
ncbi:Na+/H+ antiporter NhaC family protein [Pseudoxanthomonas sp. PXM02]|uniref:Na+/H+ antiporter NhaC family protein n=1 Tax=Pseudoxanthomonas sp. PXM02 TaxID=2769294 RepID=UPI00177E6E5E|nr:Na+/H+ antiporter NhaC family protein [Pseudoxanthomonas sp. PXM02]MBD9477959.1 Na+/H+ antiporter NhaC family protein [Pseudoxanthomonas sp. PXM02]